MQPSAQLAYKVPTTHLLLATNCTKIAKSTSAVQTLQTKTNATTCSLHEHDDSPRWLGRKSLESPGQRGTERKRGGSIKTLSVKFRSLTLCSCPGSSMIHSKQTWVADTPECQHASGAASVSSSEQTRGNMLTAVYAACPVKSEPPDLHKLSLVLHCVEVRGRHR